MTKEQKDPIRSGDIPVTKKLLDETKWELKSDIASVNLRVTAVDNKIDSLRDEMNSRFRSIDSRFVEIDARFDMIESKFSGVYSEFAKLDAKIETLISRSHRFLAIFEEQEARNRIVLDVCDQLDRRVTRLEGGPYE